MPYVQSKRKYELQRQYEQEEYVKAIESLRLAIGLKREPVGIKFLFDEEAYNASPENEIKGKMT